MTLTEAKELAAQAWCTEHNSHKAMDAELCIAFADILMARVNRAEALTRRLKSNTAKQMTPSIDCVGTDGCKVTTQTFK